MNMLSGTFVFDMDEILVNISPALYNTIRYYWAKYSLWFNDLGSLSEKEVLDRPFFMISDWLIKDVYKDENGKIKAAVKKIIFNNLLDDFFKTDIYSELTPTDFAVKTVMNPSFIEHERVKKVIILTRINCEEMVPFKDAFINKWFNHQKIDVKICDFHEKKSDYLKNVSWNLYVDDEIGNIRDVAENFDLSGKEFLVPNFGYNKLPMDLAILIREKGGVINYY